ncbi:PEGA domain-containing protein [Archangium sp.]|jgi:hypothetical protein|uniref:PEGA domain-containing protein n=1 Tax=Archangium sp. TaxID=1872627 RepID=UPI002EDB8A4C
MTLQSKRFLRLTAASTALVFSVGCASTTIIRTEPGEANLYIDGSKVGKTPYTYEDTKVVGSSTRVRITKEGYKDFETVLKRDEEFQVGPCIGGFFFLVPWLWIMGYKPEHTYELTPEKAAEKKGDINAQVGAPAAPGTI